MTTYLVNGLPLGAVKGSRIVIRELAAWELIRLKDGEFVSAIGHADTAKLLTNLLGVDVAFNRMQLEFTADNRYVVAAYCGPRLPEGCTVLPTGTKFRFFLVNIDPDPGLNDPDGYYTP